MAPQKAVEEIGSKGLLDKGGMKTKLENMRKTGQQSSNIHSAVTGIYFLGITLIVATTLVTVF
jgi:hypothetical protein